MTLTNSLERFLDEKLQHLKNNGLYNEIQTLDGQNGPTISIQNKQYINLSSNNYLGFANDPRIQAAAQEALQRYGAGAGAVRSINGTLEVHRKLEETIAKLKGTEAAIAFQSGFNCNMGAISAIMNEKDAILSDELNHASIIDGCRLSRAKIIRVKHADMQDLREKAKNARASGLYEKIMFITDGVFSMDGDLAPLTEIVKIAKEFDLITYVDDAHGSGVMGQGAGTVKHFGLAKEIDLQMGTLSKAIGVVGGYVAGTQKLIDWLKVAARPFLFSTALTPADAAAATKAIELMLHSTDRQEKLWKNGDYLKEKLKALGFNVGHSATPITPVILGDEKIAQAFSKKLFEEGIYAKAIVYPTVPLGTARIRNMPTAAHSKEMLDQAVQAYEKIGKELGIL